MTDLEYETDGMDFYLDLDSIKERPARYLNTVMDKLSNDESRNYTLEQIRGLEIFVDIAYDSLPEHIRPHLLNERINIWAKLLDLKQEQGDVFIPVYEDEPETKR